MATKTRMTKVEQVVNAVKGFSQTEAVAVQAALSPRLSYGDAMAFSLQTLMEVLHSGGGVHHDPEKGDVLTNRNDWFFSQVAVIRSLVYGVNARLSRISDEVSPLRDELREYMAQFGSSEAAIEQAPEPVKAEIFRIGNILQTLTAEEVILEELFTQTVAQAKRSGHRVEYYKRQYIEDPRKRETSSQPKRQLDLASLNKLVG